MLVIDYAMVDIILFIFIVMMIFKNVAIISNRVRVSYFRYCPITIWAIVLSFHAGLIQYCILQRATQANFQVGEEKDSIQVRMVNDRGDQPRTKLLYRRGG